MAESDKPEDTKRSPGIAPPGEPEGDVAHSGVRAAGNAHDRTTVQEHLADGGGPNYTIPANAPPSSSSESPYYNVSPENTPQPSDIEDLLARMEENLQALAMPIIETRDTDITALGADVPPSSIPKASPVPAVSTMISDLSPYLPWSPTIHAGPRDEQRDTELNLELVDPPSSGRPRTGVGSTMLSPDYTPLATLHDGSPTQYDIATSVKPKALAADEIGPQDEYFDDDYPIEDMVDSHRAEYLRTQAMLRGETIPVPAEQQVDKIPPPPQIDPIAPLHRGSALPPAPGHNPAKK